MKYLDRLNNLSAKKMGSNLFVPKSDLTQFRKLQIERITTTGGTPKNITTDSNNPLTQYENYDIDIIDDSALLNIEKNKFSEQTVKFKYAGTSFGNQLLALGKGFGHNCHNQILSVPHECVQLLSKLLDRYKSMKVVERYCEKQWEE